MEIAHLNINNQPIIKQMELVGTSSDQFIEANTKTVTLSHLRNENIIPAFSKDNESTISHADFIKVTQEATKDYFKGQQVFNPAIRVSHPIKGRVPEAKGKPAHLLSEHEKTLYYERLAFVIEIPSIGEDISDNRLSLTVGGVRAINHENLHNKKTEERFKVFVGFKNWVCTNLCISTDGLQDDIRVMSLNELYYRIYEMLDRFNGNKALDNLAKLENYELTEQQFAQLIGKARMYNHLPSDTKKNVAAFPMSDSQVNAITREYYRDENFQSHSDGSINLWKLYNLFTGANKSSYIDTFIRRGAEAHKFVFNVMNALDHPGNFWYLN